MTTQIAYRAMFLFAVVIVLAAMLGGCKHVVTYKPLDSGAHWRVEPVNIDASEQGRAYD